MGKQYKLNENGILVDKKIPTSAGEANRVMRSARKMSPDAYKYVPAGQLLQIDPEQLQDEHLPILEKIFSEAETYTGEIFSGLDNLLKKEVYYFRNFDLDPEDDDELELIDSTPGINENTQV